MKKQNPKLTKSRQKKIISLVSKYYKRLLLAALCMVVVAGATGAMAFMVKSVLDDIFINQNRDMLLVISGAAVLIFFTKGVGAFGSEYLMNYIGEKIIRFFRDALYSKITDLPISFIHKEKTGALMSRITNDVNIVKNMVSSAVINVCGECVRVIARLFVVF